MMTLNRIDEYIWEIPKSRKMRVPGRVYASEALVKQLREKEDEALQQVANVACLPGLVSYSLAMPDIHWGYGFPIGGVAAFDMEEGVISPGGVGYDINCGVRLIATNIRFADVEEHIRDLVRSLYDVVPVGVGSSGAIPKLSKTDLKDLVKKGALWAIENGYGDLEDLEFIEDYGRMNTADPSLLSEMALERGLSQVGTLGSGNHFLECGVVQEIYQPEQAKVFGLREGHMTILIHTGSRGFGYQVCEDFLKRMLGQIAKYKIDVPDKQLVCAPVPSPEAQEYLAAMACASNFAWVNRQVIMGLVRKALEKIIDKDQLEFQLIYDIAHNIAKVEEHAVGGAMKKLVVHRKGATRAYPREHPLVPPKYQGVGQPVIIPGDMGRYSYLCVGLEKAVRETFASACHGAGRLQSRKKMMKATRGRDLIRELEAQGVVVMAPSRQAIAEEMPEGYKDVSEVVETLAQAGIIGKVARMKPVGVIKG